LSDELTTEVFYKYEDERCVLDIRFDPDKNEMVLRGGRHGLARLAELFAIYALLDEAGEHSHWPKVRPEPTEFIIVLKDDLRSGQG
jgi:hypothetical protein